MNAFPSKSLSDNRKPVVSNVEPSAIQNRKWAGLFAIVVVAFTVCGARAEAQQPTKVPRIGYLSVSSPSANVGRIEAFRQGLRELGYVEGKNIVIEWRYAEGKFDRLPRWQPNWCDSRSTSSSRRARKQPASPRKQLLRFPY